MSKDSLQYDPLRILDSPGQTSSTEATTVKPGKVIRTHRPQQGQVAFVLAASGHAAVGYGMCVRAQGSFVPARYCLALGRPGRAEPKMQPGEARA